MEGYLFPDTYNFFVNSSNSEVIERLVDIQYTRNDYDFHRATFRVRGDVLEVIPSYQHEQALRLEYIMHFAVFAAGAAWPTRISAWIC